MFNVIYAKYHKHIFNFAMKLSRNYEIAEEATQDTFLVLHQKLDIIKIEYLPAYLFGTCRNVLYTKGRKDLRESGIMPHDVVSNEKLAERIVEEDYMDTKIEKFLSSITSIERTVFYLKNFEKLAYKEIAAILSLSVRTVARIVARLKLNFV